MAKFKFTIHGARGSEPVSGSAYCKYGGRTSCYGLETPEGIIILDAGSGIVPLGRTLNHMKKIPPIDIFFTHFHMDHVMGLPLFRPLYRKDATVCLWADGTRSGEWQQTIKTIAGKPIWPVEITEAGASITFEDLPTPGTILKRWGVNISWCVLRHPQTSLSYKIEVGGKTVVLATDREYKEEDLDEGFIQFCDGSDILIHDAQYLPEEYPDHWGWGHSTWEQAAITAKKASVGELILTHHDALHTDKKIDAIVKKAKKIFPRTRAAREDMVLVEA